MTEFTYDKMTPALQAYLDHSHRSQHPGYKYPRDADGKMRSGVPTPESEAAVDAWRAEGERLLEVAGGRSVLDAFYQTKKLWFCRGEGVSPAGGPRESTSPSGKYRLVVTRHSTGGGGWNYSKGRVYVGDKLITEVCRNFASFPFAWVENHGKTQGDYLICGEDYQGQTIVDLVSGDRVNHRPDSANQGFGFCWSSIHPNQDGTLLAVCGCHWACPYEVRLVDFEDPMNPPWLILDTDDDDYFDGWQDDGTCKIGRSFEVVDLPGHPLDGKKEDDCSMEELEEVEKYVVAQGVPEGECDEAGWKMAADTHTWTRPSYVEVTRKWVTSYIPWFRDRGGVIHHDQAKQFDLMWTRLTQAEKGALLADPELGPMVVEAIDLSFERLSPVKD